MYHTDFFALGKLIIILYDTQMPTPERPPCMTNPAYNCVIECKLWEEGTLTPKALEAIREARRQATTDPQARAALIALGILGANRLEERVYECPTYAAEEAVLDCLVADDEE